MVEQEKFSVTKFFSSFTQWLPWVKTLRYVIGAFIVLALIFTIWKAFFKKERPTQDINVESGGTVHIVNEANKRHLILFAEPFVSVATNDDFGVGIRAGVRWEF